MFLVSPKKTALDGWVPLAMRVRNFVGSWRCRSTLYVPLVEDGVASALPELAPGSKRFASTAILEMYEGDNRVTIGESQVGPVDQDNLIAGCSGCFDRTSPASRRQSRFCRDRLVAVFSANRGPAQVSEACCPRKQSSRKPIGSVRLLQCYVAPVTLTMQIRNRSGASGFKHRLRR
jgi:hypothetical protein